MVNMIKMRKRRRLLMKMRMSRRLMRRMTLAGVRVTLLWVEFCLLSPAQN